MFEHFPLCHLHSCGYIMFGKKTSGLIEYVSILLIGRFCGYRTKYIQENNWRIHQKNGHKPSGGFFLKKKNIFKRSNICSSVHEQSPRSHMDKVVYICSANCFWKETQYYISQIHFTSLLALSRASNYVSPFYLNTHSRLHSRALWEYFCR